MAQNIYFGVVENRSDPLELGRCQVRVVGLHTHDKNLLPTADLPWCATMQPTISAAMNGIGWTPIGPVEGSSVIVMYLDDIYQQGVIMGAVGGIATEPVPIDFDDSGPIVKQDVSTETIRLRSIPGPVTGQQITLYDPESNRSNLTSKLEANMRVSGYGIEYGTVIVSIDSGTQITISTVVRDFGENIINFDPPLASVKSVIESKTNITGSTLDQKAEPIKTTPVNSEIPTLPPLPEFKNTQTKASEGIKALIAACDKVGLTTKEQKCALLGIAGGESGWVPKKEAYNYSPSRLKEIFSFATEEDVAKYSNATKNGVSREEFFSWCYGPTKRGKGFFGHKTDEEAGKYYGRGFIQLTGYSNYKRYNDLAVKAGLAIDIVNDPDSLDSDINVSALVAALYIKDRVPSAVNPNSHPDYFYAAKKAVGVNSPDIAAKKLSYYEYFYGKQAAGGVVKDAAASAPDVASDDTDGTPGPSKKSIETGSFGLGFRDPNNKYPLKAYIGESDVNRLARGIIDGTIVTLKDANRKMGIPKAFGGSWDQPQAPYGSKYPFNKVLETESGHVQEFDDTPGQERVQTYHRTGTFTEVDPNGTQVNYIVGDNFILMEQNGCIHVAGECNITVDGNTNIYARSDANIQVAQNAKVEVGNNLEVGVANDATMAVGGDFQLKVAGKFGVDANGISIKSQENLNIQSVGDFSTKGANINVESLGDANYLSSGETRMDYAEGQFGNGAAGSPDVETLEIPVPEAGTPMNSVIKYSVPPPRQFEEKAVIETPEDWDTPEGRSQIHKQSSQEGIAGAPQPVADEQSGVITGGAKNSIPVDTSKIQNTKDFSNDYKLSKSVVLGMMISGGVGGKHRLTPQMLKPNAQAPERLYTVQEIVSNLSQTANNVLEPILDVLPGGRSGYNSQWVITSGYRLRGVVPNESPISDHCKGHCVDIALTIPDKYNKTFDLVQKIEPLIVYDQLILEYRHPDSVWIHISYRKDNNRRMAFTMVNDKTYKRNSLGLPAGFFLINNIPPKGK